MPTPTKAKEEKAPKQQVDIRCMFSPAKSSGAVKIENPNLAQAKCLAQPVQIATAKKSPPKKPPPHLVAEPALPAPATQAPPKAGALAVAPAVALPPTPSVTHAAGSADGAKPPKGDAPLPNEGPAMDEADCAGGGSNAMNVSADKGQYNKFAYRLKGAPQDVQAMWESLLKTKNQVAIDEFFVSILKHKKGCLPDNFLKSLKEINDVTETGDEGGWYPWKEIAEKEGHDALIEMVTAGTVTIRRNPRLPITSQIPYPLNQQVAYEQEKWSRKRQTIEGKRLEGELPQEEHEAFETQFASAKKATKISVADCRPGGSRDGQAPGQGQGTDPKGQPSERDKNTIAQLRKTHSLWDRAKREYQGLVSKSKGNPNTRGTAFEVALEAAINQGSQADSTLMGYETQYLGGRAFTDEDVSNLMALTNELVDLIKTSNKKATALRPWFKVDQ